MKLTALLEYCRPGARNCAFRGLLAAVLLIACTDETQPGSADSAVIGTDGGATTTSRSDAGPRSSDSGPRASATTDAAQPSGQVDGGEPSESDATTPIDSGSAVEPFDPDRALFFGDSRCAAANLIFCDGFEDVTSGSSPSASRWQGDDDIRVDDSRAARGTRALHVVTGDVQPTHFVRTTDTTARLSRVIWGRLFLYVGTRPNAFNHWTVVELTGQVPEGGTARIRMGGIVFPGSRNELDFNFDIWGGRPANFVEVGTQAQDDLADGTWHCLEWYFDADTRSVRIFKDNLERTDLAAMGSLVGGDPAREVPLAFPSFDGLNLGLADYQTVGGRNWDVWIDEVAADDERVGCIR